MSLPTTGLFNFNFYFLLLLSGILRTLFSLHNIFYNSDMLFGIALADKADCC